MSSGRIIQIIGAVIDVEFERNSVPKIYDALHVDGTETTLEVQQQLGDGVVRTIAMGSTEGLKLVLLLLKRVYQFTVKRHLTLNKLLLLTF